MENYLDSQFIPQAFSPMFGFSPEMFNMPAVNNMNPQGFMPQMQAGQMPAGQMMPGSMPNGNMPNGNMPNGNMPMLTDEQLEMMCPQEYRNLSPHVMNALDSIDEMGPITPEMIEEMTSRVMNGSGMADPHDDEAMPVMARFGHVFERRRFGNRDLARLLILRELLERRRCHRNRNCAPNRHQHHRGRR